MPTAMTPEAFLREVVRPLVESMLAPATLHELSIRRQPAGLYGMGTGVDELQAWFVSLVAGAHREGHDFYLGPVQDLRRSTRVLKEGLGTLVMEAQSWASEKGLQPVGTSVIAWPDAASVDVVLVDPSAEVEPAREEDLVSMTPEEFLREVIRPMVESMLDAAMIHELSIHRHQDEFAVWPEPRPSGSYLRLHHGTLPTRKGPERWYVLLVAGPEHERLFFSVGDVADVCDDPAVLGQGLGMLADGLEDWACESRFGWGTQFRVTWPEAALDDVVIVAPPD